MDEAESLEAQCRRLIDGLLEAESLEAQFRGDDRLDPGEALLVTFKYLGALSQCVYLIARRVDALQ